MPVKKKYRQVGQQTTSVFTEPKSPADPIKLEAVKPPDTFFQLALHMLDRIGGRNSHILFAAMLICGAFAFVWSQIPEQGKLNIINHIVNASQRAVGVYPSVEIDETHLKFDLTEWTPVPPGGDTSQSCKVTTDENLLARRTYNDAIYLARRASTSGKEPQFTSSSHYVSYQKSNYQRVGGSHMSHYDILLDISKEPVNTPFKAHLRSVRYGAFRDPNSEWASAVVYQPTRALTIEIILPSNKPGRNFRFSTTGEYDGNNNLPLYPIWGQSLSPSPGQYEIKDNTIKWRLQFPKIGYCYRIDWDW